MRRPDKSFLKRLREIAGENVTAFARRLEMSQTQINYYVKGQRTPSYEFFHQLVTKGCSVDWLITGKDSSDIDLAARRIALAISELTPEKREALQALIEAYVQIETQKRGKT